MTLNLLKYLDGTVAHTRSRVEQAEAERKKTTKMRRQVGQKLQEESCIQSNVGQLEW